MVATAGAYRSRGESPVSIAWHARTLKEFGVLSVEELARQFDLIVIDHPHIGTMADTGCVVALDDYVDLATMETLSAASPGGSHQSYHYAGHQWAFAIDAACQTSTRRDDLLANAPVTWDDVIELAQGGRVMWPLCAVDAAASFMTLTNALGEACAQSPEYFVSREIGRWALATMYDVARPSDPTCLDANPIHALDAMATTDDYVYGPLAFCYVNYSRHDFTGHHVSFGNIPSRSASLRPRGSLLGGAGLAVSAHSDFVDEAVAYALYVASPEVQRGLYFSSGGQPAHQAAWTDSSLDAESGGFFSGVGPVLSDSWTRPNRPGFASFQTEMITLFEDWYDHAPAPNSFLDKLDELHRTSVDVEPTAGE